MATLYCSYLHEVYFWGYLIPMGKVLDQKLTMRRKALTIELIGQGLGVVEVARRLGIHRNTINYWLQKDSRFSKAIEKAKEQYAKETIEGNLWKLATGCHEEETSEQWIGTKRLKDGREVPVTYSRKVKVRAPSEKALMALASKYAPKEYEKDHETTINVKITQRDRSLTTEERIKLLESEGSEVVEVNDFRELSSSDAVDYGQSDEGSES
jgi:transposase-like protein